MPSQLALIQTALINDSIQISTIEEITGISKYKLQKTREALAEGRDMPGMDWLLSKPFAWTQEQVAHLTSTRALFQQNQQTLVERTANLNSFFPAQNITVYRLRQLYLKYKIKQRVLRVEIQLNASQLRNQFESRMIGFSRLVEAFERREHVYYMDEAIFSSKQVSPTIWYTPQSRPVFLPKKKTSFKAIAVAAAIDMNGKVVAYQIQDDSIDTDAFCVFLDYLKQHIGRRKAVLLLDNLGVHRTHKSRLRAELYNIELVFNGTYSSEQMPIERLWAWSKRQFTKRCAEDAPYHNQAAMRRLVRDVILEDYQHGLKKRIQTCLNSMKDWLKSNRGLSFLQSQERMVEPMQSVSNAIGDAAAATVPQRQPNEIGNAEEQNQNAQPAIQFSKYLLQEERKGGNTKMTLDQFTRKVHSKHDLLYALSIKGQMYLPEKRYCTMDFLRSVLSGRKSVFKNSEVRRVKVPRYKQLTLKQVMDHCANFDDMTIYLPDLLESGESHVDREFLFTIVNTLDADYFPKQLQSIECARRQKAQDLKQDIIEVKPEIMALLESFDAPPGGKSRGSTRALCMLKQGAKKRKRPLSSADDAQAALRQLQLPVKRLKRSR